MKLMEWPNFSYFQFAHRMEEKKKEFALPQPAVTRKYLAAVLLCLVVGGVWIFSNCNERFCLGRLWPGHYPLSGSIQAENIKQHLKQLEAIALSHPSGSRSVLNGFNASAEYVMNQLLEKTDCILSTQPFRVPVWTDKGNARLNLIHPYVTSYQEGHDFRVMRYGGVSASLVGKLPKYIPNNGCSDSNYEQSEWQVGDIVMLDAPLNGASCSFWDAAYRAERLGASGVMFVNPVERQTLLNSRIRTVHWSDGDPLMSIPVLSVSYSVGEFFRSESDVKVDLFTDTDLTIADTFNVICDTREGDPENTVIIGAHLDSVPAGPGMVDDGTGTSAILEVFLKMYETGLNKKLKNRMRFAWWGAEELGLMGSRHYCRELSKNADEMKQIAMYSNHDMLGAPNYIPYIHNGATAPDSVRTASTQITELYASYFATLSRSSKFFNNYALDAMTGGSDYYSFLEISVPAGGLATGAGSIKTMKERSKYGGLANAAYDPCYHQKCDSIENVNFEVLEVLTRSVAHAVERTGSMPNLRQWLGSAQ